jgi:hypothetical protein
VCISQIVEKEKIKRERGKRRERMEHSTESTETPHGARERATASKPKSRSEQLPTSDPSPCEAGAHFSYKIAASFQ